MASAPRGVVSLNPPCRRAASEAPPVRMPTRPVESVTPEGGLLKSSWQSSSGSGRFIEIVLKDDCRGRRMRGVLVFASAAARLAQMRFRRHRGQAFVGERYGKPEPPLQPPREAPGAPRH